MEPCIACGALTMITDVLPSYDDDAFGIPVTLKNAVLRHRCESCGMDGIEIPDSDGLSAALAVARVMYPVKLSGAEIRFLRKACGMTGKEFAEAVQVDNATLSRWENCQEGGHGAVTDRAIRAGVWGLLYSKTPAIHAEPDHFTKMRIKVGPVPRFVFERVRLKDPVRHTKEDAWDIRDQAA